MYKSDSAPWLEFYAWNTDGSAKTDLVYNTSGISIVVVRDNLANSSALTLSAASGPTDWAAGKLWAMGGNKYRVGIATASISSFTGKISVEGIYTGGVITGVTESVSAYNPAYDPLRPTTAGRTIDVDAAGAVELDSATQTQIADILTDTGTTIPVQISALSGSTVQVASPNVSGNLVLTQGDDYDGTANPKASWTVTTDYTSGWTVALTIRDADDAVVYTTAGTVVSSTVVAVTIAAPTGLTMTGCPGQWQGKFDVQLTHTATGKKKTIALGVCYINEDQTR